MYWLHSTTELFGRAKQNTIYSSERQIVRTEWKYNLSEWRRVRTRRLFSTARQNGKGATRTSAATLTAADIIVRTLPKCHLHHLSSLAYRKCCGKYFLWTALKYRKASLRIHKNVTNKQKCRWKSAKSSSAAHIRHPEPHWQVRKEYIQSLESGSQLWNQYLTEIKIMWTSVWKSGFDFAAHGGLSFALQIVGPAVDTWSDYAGNRGLCFARNISRCWYMVWLC